MSKKDYTATPEFEQGRAALRGAISIDEAPYAEDDKHLEAWKAGYEFEKQTLGIDRKSDEKPKAKAVGQTATASKAK